MPPVEADIRGTSKLILAIAARSSSKRALLLERKMAPHLTQLAPHCLSGYNLGMADFLSDGTVHLAGSEMLI